ncbi:radical SAM/SPASM domain protein, ACGX system [Candidatus Methanosphaera massiliense]|mgnify:CR=1 FL=1|jgi:radical SAM/SPASM domain protein of ACGX system|uniref:radical SAM/SPASM domain protein, ACGX system n=1 Tax=Methanosphaera TaxID=2316 RepID=UPI00238005AD|nr:radical SAM/SPASM domain protein, ACGX system [Candidatus Methanosphaera massiliense]MDE4078647.1 radical SAM/SPASM domain protein, ACGX system [Candidatus Methanosphaera massiliense]
MRDFFAFQWHITDECDQRCKHCYIFNNEHTTNLTTTSINDLEDIFNNCINMCNIVNREPFFYVTGGDPLLHPDFWKLINLFKENNIKFGIMGNPFHLTSEVCEKLKDAGCLAYQLSLDGLRKTHDYFRMPGSYDTTLDKIKVLKDAGMNVNIMTTVSKVNMDEIPELIDVVVEHGVDTYSFARYCPEGFDEDSHMTPEEYHQFLEKCWDKYEQYKDSSTNFDLKDHLWTLFLYEKGLFEIPSDLDDDVIYDGCNCGNSHVTILPNGNVYACRRMNSLIGNAFEENIVSLFTSRKMDEYRQYENFEKCSKCELLRFCRGCPAVSYGYTGSMYSSDPQCWKKI